MSVQYQIFRLSDESWRVVWEGPLENKRPAEDAEHLTLELNRGGGLCRGPQTIQLDLVDCNSVNSRGIAFLVYCRRRILDHGALWSIVGAPESLRQMLEILNLDTAFNITDSEVSSVQAPVKGERIGIGRLDQTLDIDRQQRTDRPIDVDGPIEFDGVRGSEQLHNKESPEGDEYQPIQPCETES